MKYTALCGVKTEMVQHVFKKAPRVFVAHVYKILRYCPVVHLSLKYYIMVNTTF